MNVRTRLQLVEALGPVNRWYCSQAYGFPVENADRLWTYFIKSGGAEDFSDRYEEAMGAVNRWYCSEYYGREIGDPEILWHYYNDSREPRHPWESDRRRMRIRRMELVHC